MLQQILKDMYIDPDVLNALNEDQKKTLFLKMRQEQVRRWKEREEKLEREGGSAEATVRTKPKTANSKKVSWLLGRDGDVAVIVIGEVDELKTSKIICSGFGEKKGPSLHNSACHQKTILKNNLVHKTATEPPRTGRENFPPKTQPGKPFNLKGTSDEVSPSPPLQVSVSEHSSPPAVEKQELKSSSAAEDISAAQPSICYRPHTRASPITVRSASANVGLGSANTRPGPANLRLAAVIPICSSTDKIDPEPTSSTKASFHQQEPQRPLSQESHSGKDNRAAEACQRATPEETRSGESAAACAGRGRVAQLMKTFSVESSTAPTQTPSRGNKPPLPSKPSHLRLVSSHPLR
ncbi:SH2 domain-containing protein 4A [Lampris incognitus]|uniref:SH2 domain-containing protein 4A n=1 Tax=Lampris incognitus TaxID=2546036 RepID=UPI0024B6252C|nr:SH2 domain-containing protein 4A [Lampris incognitus]XP_056140593.1 SH2 domain-containing protein 4A [Lampris incognitus]XP_056140594.1 SH2 domain-containing protein 4A [Lampris incognitus]